MCKYINQSYKIKENVNESLKGIFLENYFKKVLIGKETKATIILIIFSISHKRWYKNFLKMIY